MKEIITINGIIEYSLDKDTITYEGEQWTNPKSPAYTLEDTGEGYLFRDRFLKTKVFFGYDQFEGIRVLGELLCEKLEIKRYKEVD